MTSKLRGRVQKYLVSELKSISFFDEAANPVIHNGCRLRLKHVQWKATCRQATFQIRSETQSSTKMWHDRNRKNSKQLWIPARSRACNYIHAQAWLL